MPRVPPRMELEISRGRFCPGRSFGADLRSRLHSAGRIRGSPALEVEPDAPRSNVDCIKSRLATTASRPLRRQRLRRGAARPAWREGAAAGGEPRGPAHAPAQRREIAWRPGKSPRYLPGRARVLPPGLALQLLAMTSSTSTRPGRGAERLSKAWNSKRGFSVFCTS